MNYREIALRKVINNLLEAFDALDECDCGGAPTCPICNAHETLRKLDEDRDNINSH